MAAFGVESGGETSGGVSALMDLAPPGVDELLGIVSVAELLLQGLGQGRRAESLRSRPTLRRAQGRPEQSRGTRHSEAPREVKYDLLIIDTAPTGHALRLLEMPDAARGWVQALMRVLLKYRALVHPGKLAAELLELSQSIGRLQVLLHDHDASRFIVVTRAAEMPRVETARLIRRLRALHLAAPALIVNAMTLAPGTCARCRATAATERTAFAALTRSRGRSAIILTPLSEPPPRGIAALERWAAHWRTEH